MLRRNPPGVADDAVQIGIGAGGKRSVSRAGGSDRVIVAAIDEIRSLQQKVEASLGELGTKAYQIVVSKLIDHQHDDELRFVDDARPAARLRPGRQEWIPKRQYESK